MTTPNLFEIIKNFFETNLFGSIALFALFVIFILVLLILAARVSFKVALILLLPAVLAVFGVGISQGLLGHNYRWIPVLVVIGIAIGGLAVMYFKLTE